MNNFNDIKIAKFVRKGLRWERKKREHDEIERVNDENVFNSMKKNIDRLSIISKEDYETKHHFLYETINKNPDMLQTLQTDQLITIIHHSPSIFHHALFFAFPA